MSLVRGQVAMVNKIKSVKMPDRIGRAEYAEAQIEMTEMKRRTPVSPTAAQFRAMGRSMPKGLVPGALRNSGQVSEPMVRGNQIITVLSFGNAAIDYAIIQHERLDFFHTTGQAKYMESVLNESRNYMGQRIARRIKL